MAIFHMSRVAVVIGLAPAIEEQIFDQGGNREQEQNEEQEAEQAHAPHMPPIM